MSAILYRRALLASAVVSAWTERRKGRFCSEKPTEVRTSAFLCERRGSGGAKSEQADLCRSGERKSRPAIHWWQSVDSDLWLQVGAEFM